jgi:hypothetical protein
MPISFDGLVKFNAPKEMVEAAERVAEGHGMRPSEWLRLTLRNALLREGADLSRRESAA